MAKKVSIQQVRSVIGRPLDQKRTIEALGLGKINRIVVKEINPQIDGMINKVRHLVTVKEA